MVILRQNISNFVPPLENSTTCIAIAVVGICIKVCVIRFQASLSHRKSPLPAHWRKPMQNRSDSSLNGINPYVLKIATVTELNLFFSKDFDIRIRSRIFFFASNKFQIWLLKDVLTKKLPL